MPDTRPGSESADPDAVPVTFVASTSRVAGANLYFEAILAGLGPPWIRAVVVLGEGEFPRRLRRSGYPVIAVRAGRRAGGRAGAAWRLRRILRRGGTQVVLASGARAARVATMATMASDHRVVWLKQSVGLDGTAARVLVARRCDQVIGLGEAVVRPFAAALDGRVHVVRPGVPDYEFDRERDRREVVTALGCPSDAELIVVSGRICPQKGQQELVELAPRILAERQRARIVFIGDTSPAEREHADRLRARARALGVERRVSFLGAVEPAEDAVRFVSGCDLLVAPSMRGHRTGWEEGNGFSVVEAMYVGTPVVAYANGALPEVLGGCGAVIEEGDREGLGRAIVDVLGDQARRDRMAQCGSSHARSHHRRADAIEAMKARIRASAVASA